MSAVGIGFAAVALGSLAVGAARRALERRRAHRELVTKPLLGPAIPEGTIVRVTGVVRVLDRTIEAPLSGTPCVVVRSQVRPGSRLGTITAALRPKETLQMVPFLLEREGEGAVSIEGEHVLLDLPPLSLPRPRGRDSDERTRRERFLLGHGLSLRRGGRAVFWETVVTPGMTISVAGLMMKDVADAPPSEELGFREAGAPTLRLAGNAEHPLVIGAPLA